MTHLGVYASPLFPQYDLVCGNAWMLDLSQAILNLGFLAGAFILGYAADRYSMSSYFGLLGGETTLSITCNRHASTFCRFNSLGINIPKLSKQNPANVIFALIWAGNYMQLYLLVVFRA